MMTTRETADDWGRRWLAARPEYARLDRVPVDQVTDAALPDLPVRFQDQARRSWLRSLFVGICRTEGMRHVGRTADGSAVYAYVVRLNRLELIEDFVRPQLQRIDADVASLEGLIQEWVDENPDAGATVAEILAEARAA